MGEFARHWRSIASAVAALGLAVGLVFGFLPVSVHSSAGQTVNCGSAFIKATINILVAGDDRITGAESEAASEGIVNLCGSRRGRNRAFAVVLLAASVAVTLAVTLSQKFPADKP